MATSLMIWIRAAGSENSCVHRPGAMILTMSCLCHCSGPGTPGSDLTLLAIEPDRNWNPGNKASTSWRSPLHISHGCKHGSAVFPCAGAWPRKCHNQGESPGLLTLGLVSGELSWAIVWEEPKQKPRSPRPVHHPDTTLVQICPFPGCVE